MTRVRDASAALPFSPGTTRPDPKLAREWFERGCSQAAHVLRDLIEEINQHGIIKGPAVTFTEPEPLPDDEQRSDPLARSRRIDPPAHLRSPMSPTICGSRTTTMPRSFEDEPWTRFRRFPIRRERVRPSP